VGANFCFCADGLEPGGGVGGDPSGAAAHLRWATVKDSTIRESLGSKGTVGGGGWQWWGRW
jgi:hypothetical protein